MVTTRKRKLRPADAMAEIERLRLLFGPPAAASPDSLDLAMEASAAGRFQFWDAMLLAAAGAAGCTSVISEEMGHGARLGPVQVIRAFAGTDPSPEALALLA